MLDNIKKNKELIGLFIFIYIFIEVFLLMDHIGAASKTITISSDPANILSINGLVGIQTAAPNRNLHIYDTSNNAEIDIQSTNVTNSHWAIYHNSADSALRFWSTNTDNALTIANNGCVGIGKTNPATRLDVNGTINASVGYAWRGSNGLSGSYNYLPYSFGIWGGIWTTIAGVTGTTQTFPIMSNTRECYLEFNNGILQDACR